MRIAPRQNVEKGTHGMTERRSLMEGSGRAKAAISPSFDEPGTRFGVDTGRRRDINRTIERRRGLYWKRPRRRERVYQFNNASTRANGRVFARPQIWDPLQTLKQVRYKLRLRTQPPGYPFRRQAVSSGWLVGVGEQDRTNTTNGPQVQGARCPKKTIVNIRNGNGC